MTRAFRFSVPGNLLLAGEYAVLEEGGLGWALAVEPRLTITSQRYPEWAIRGLLPQSEVMFRLSDKPQKTDVLGQLFLALWKRFHLIGSRSLPSTLVTIDSRPFFDANGRKKGLGSSAALACGLAAILARLGGRSDLLSVYHEALQAHREVQQGYGSGYDVTASWFGGLGLFYGGEVPHWTTGSTAHLPNLAFITGKESVRTVNAIVQYQRWKAQNPAMAREFLQKSNKAVQMIVQAPTWVQRCLAWEEYKKMSLDIGQKIGVKAEFDVDQFFMNDFQEGKDPVFFKALGAGNEIGLVAGPRLFSSRLQKQLNLLTVAEQGICEE